MHRSTRLLASALFAALTLVACGSNDSATDAAAVENSAGASADAAAESVIEINDFAFSGDFDFVAGETVRVVNNDSAPHTFTATDGSFDTGTIEPGASATFVVPDIEGSFDVLCSIHPSMTGQVQISA